MEHFTNNNTEGFNTEELQDLNVALNTLAQLGFNNDENHISDFLLNFYTPGTTPIQYVKEYIYRKGA